MKTVFFTLLLALALTIGCSSPTDSEEATSVDEIDVEGAEQAVGSTDPSTGETTGGPVSGAMEKTGGALERAGGTVDAVIEGATTMGKTVGKTASDAAKGVKEGAKGNNPE